MMDQDISIVIPTLNGGHVFSEMLSAVEEQEYEGKVQVVVVDSGSSDGTPERAEQAGATVLRIAGSDFHHAGTRNLALGHADHDPVVFMVQDAVPASRTWLEALRRAVAREGVAAAYGRQIPLDTAGPYGRFNARAVSDYLGPEPLLQRIEDENAYARMSFGEAYRMTRLDNVCAVYRRDALLDRPFPDVPYAEDMAWALETLLAGGKILYDPSIVVKHSHDRAPEYLFRRHLVDTVWCVEILGKMRREPLAAEVDDLIRAFGGLGAILGEILEEVCPSIAGASGVRLSRGFLPGLKEGLSAEHRHLRPMWGESAEEARRSSKGSRLALDRLEGDVRSIWEGVRTEEDSWDPVLLEDVLEKIGAGVLGAFYGEVYAGALRRGLLDRSLQSFLAPFLTGV